MRAARCLASLCGLACLLASATDQVCNSPHGVQAIPAPDDGETSSLIALRRTRGQATPVENNSVVYIPRFPSKFQEGGSASDCLSAIPKTASANDLYEMTLGCQLLAETYLLQGIVKYTQLLSNGVVGQMPLDKFSHIFNDSARYRLVNDSCYEVVTEQGVHTQDISATSESSYESTLSNSMGVSVSAGAGFAGFQVSSSYDSNSASSSATVGQQYSSSVQKLYQYSVARITNRCLTNPQKAGTYITKSTQDAWTKLIDACESFVPVNPNTYTDTSCDWARANAKVVTTPSDYGKSTPYWTAGVESASECGHVNCFGAGWESESGYGWKCPSSACWDQGLWCVLPEFLGWDSAANGVAEAQVFSYMSGTGPGGFMLPTESTFGSRYMYDLTSSYIYKSDTSSQEASTALSAAMSVSYEGATASTSYQKSMQSAFTEASADTQQTLAVTMDENNNINLRPDQTYDDMVTALEKNAQEWMNDPTLWTSPGISSMLPIDSVLEVDRPLAALNAVTSLTWYAGLQPATPSCSRFLPVYTECLLTPIACLAAGCNSYYGGGNWFTDMCPDTDNKEWTCCCI